MNHKVYCKCGHIIDTGYEAGDLGPALMAGCPDDSLFSNKHELFETEDQAREANCERKEIKNKRIGSWNGKQKTH